MKNMEDDVANLNKKINGLKISDETLPSILIGIKILWIGTQIICLHALRLLFVVGVLVFTIVNRVYKGTKLI